MEIANEIYREIRTFSLHNVLSVSSLNFEQNTLSDIRTPMICNRQLFDG